jgi:catechol 2,3-dioxygenase-like lactoylglutathione lyase family enzyme
MPETLPVEFIHHVSRVTRDLERSREFYIDVLGFQPIQRPNFSFPGAWLFNYGLQIHLIQTPEPLDPPITEPGTRADHIAFRVSDIDAVERSLNERGIAFRESVVPQTGVRQIFFLDPDGNHIECGMYPPTPAPE